MQMHDIINKHDNQITEIKNCLSDITTNIKVMMNDYGHLSNKVEDILKAITAVQKKTYTLPQSEETLESLEIQVTKLSHKLDEQTARITRLEEKSNRFSNLMVVVRQYWPIILMIIAAIGWLIDFAYKLDPPK